MKTKASRTTNLAVSLALVLIGAAAIAIGTIWALEIPEADRMAATSDTIVPGFTILAGVAALAAGIIKSMTQRQP